MIHGFLETQSIWNAFSAELSKQFRVICVDLPGHGKSELLEPVHTMDLMADVVRAVLERENIGKVVLLGHSMGGYVAATVAEKYPDLAQGLVFFHSHAAPDSEAVKNNRARMIQIVNENKLNFVTHFIPNLFAETNVAKFQPQIEQLQQTASQMSSEAIVAALGGMRDRRGSLDFLAQTAVPVLFVAGKQDTRLSYKQVLEQVQIPAQGELLLLDHVGHMGHFEAEATTRNAVSHFALRAFEIRK